MVDDFSELDISELPWVLLKSKHSLPEISAVYFVIDSNQNIQYIGQAINLKARWRNHHRESQLNTMQEIRLSWLEVLDKGLLRAVETALISHFNPLLNGTRVENNFVVDESISVSCPESRTFPKIALALSPGSTEKLERYAMLVGKGRLATTAAYLLQQKLDELDEAGEIPEDQVVLSHQDFDQIVKFVKLLVGDRSKRNGISFVLLGNLLGIESSKLSELYSVLEKCRQEHGERSQV